MAGPLGSIGRMESRCQLRSVEFKPQQAAGPSAHGNRPFAFPESTQLSLQQIRRRGEEDS